jgi:ribonucleoside-diphosphate reductase alpha chain
MGEAVQAFTAGPDIDMQPASLDIWDKKYRLKDRAGKPRRRRHSRHLQAHRARAGRRRRRTTTSATSGTSASCGLLQNGALPAGRIISNAGAQELQARHLDHQLHRVRHHRDSMDDILSKNHEAGLTLKAGCGIGYEFSTLRPKGAYVSGAGAYTSGPLSFMDIYDKMCFTVSSAGGRRGAQMATFDIGHPDVLEFIRAKREDGRLRQFNLSLLITRRVHPGGQEPTSPGNWLPGRARGPESTRSTSTIATRWCGASGR